MLCFDVRRAHCNAAQQWLPACLYCVLCHTLLPRKINLICKCKMYAKLKSTFDTMEIKEEQEGGCVFKTHFHMKWQPLVFFPLPWEWDRDRWGLELIYIANVFGSNDDDTGTMWGGRLRTYLRESVRTRGKLPQVHIEVFIICVLFLCLQMMVSLRASCERGENYIL